jgi:hypothetical protein
MTVIETCPWVYVVCTIARRSKNLIWVKNGTLDMDLGDGHQKLVELRLSEVRVQPDGRIKMPSWLAREKGLA